VNRQKLTKRHIPCPCGESSDAYSEYETFGKCYSCDKTFKLKGVDTLETNPENKSLQIIPLRGLDKGTLSRYNVYTEVVNDTPKSLIFPYKNFQKYRALEHKRLWVVGEHRPGLFGTEAHGSKDGLKSLVITEGEIDAMSVFQMTGVPAVSVQSSSMALNDCRADFEYLNSAEKIYLCFDADEPGQKAAAQVAQLFSHEKVFKISLDEKLKDANKYLEEGLDSDFLRAYRGAKKFVPDGVISSFSEVEEALGQRKDKPVCAWPISSLENKLEGLRLGKTYLVSGLEGIGKTEIVRAVEYKVLQETDFNIGIVHLEEPKEDVVNNLLSYHVHMALRKDKNNILTVQEKMDRYREMVKRDNRVHIFNHFGSDDPNHILGIIRFLVTVCGCKFIFLDHVNIVVSGLGADGDERRTLDYLCTRLATMANELNFCLVFVCHENDDGRPRGSRNISQTAHVHIRLSRNLEAEDAEDRNKLYLSVAKNRPTSDSGPAGYAYYDPDLGHLTDPNVSVLNQAIAF